jgi:hypothetical protein
MKIRRFEDIEACQLVREFINYQKKYKESKQINREPGTVNQIT